MAAPHNHWKLGLFVVIGLALALGTVAFLGARSMVKEVVAYVSYFDESVQGLEVGSPIKFRGVTIGYVANIQVAPDRRHVEVITELGVEELIRLGLDAGMKPALSEDPRRLKMAADLRLQLASSGLTGVKFLQLDFFDVDANPLPDLPFPVPDHYIPTVPSMLKNLDDSLTRMMNSLPEITERASSILGEVESMVRDLRDQQIPEHITATIETANTLLVTVQDKVGQLDTEELSNGGKRTLAAADDLFAVIQKKLEQLDAEGLSHSALQTLRSVDDFLATAREAVRKLDTAGLSRGAARVLADASNALGQLGSFLSSAGRDGGLLASIEGTSNAIGDMVRDADGLGEQLVDTLAAVQASLRSIRRLTDALELDPDMLLKGRNSEREP
jgi:paraquat-inducible protein B